MKHNRKNSFLATTLMLAVATSAAHAANGTWRGADGNWSDPSTWADDSPADGSGFTAYFTGIDIEADKTITLTAPQVIGNITFTDATTASHNLTISGASTLTLAGTPVISVTDTGRTLTISSVIDGVAGLTKTGAGTLILKGINTYTGATTISGGTLSVDLPTQLGAPASDLVFDGGTLNITGIALTSLAGLGRTNPVVFNADKTVGFDIKNSALIFTAGQVLNQGTGGLTKLGAGTVVLNQANTYTGATTISAGTLQFATQTALYNNDEANWTAAKINVATGGTLALKVGGSDEFTTANVTTLLTNLGGTNGTGTTGFAAGSAITFDTTNASGGTFTVSAEIANSTGTGGGAISLTKQGAGTLVLDQPNTYTGTTTVTSGLLKLDNANAIPGGVAKTGGNSNLSLNGGVIGLTSNFSRSIGIGVDQVQWGSNGGGFAAFGADRTVNFGDLGNATPWMKFGTQVDRLEGKLYLSDSTATHTVTVANAFDFLSGSRTFSVADGAAEIDAVLSGSLHSGGSGKTNKLIKEGPGTLVLTGAYTGYTNNSLGATVTAGTLSIGGAGWFAYATNSGLISIATGATLNHNSSANQTLSGVISGGGVITKTGIGTLTLTNANTYTGRTTVTGGTLVIDSIQDAGSVTANALGQPAVGVDSIIDIGDMGTLKYTGTGHSSDRVVNLATLTGGAMALDASGASGTFALTGGVTSTGTSGISTLTLTGTGLGSESAAITDGTSPNVTAVTKSGIGTWTLSGANTYSGNTTVSTGTLSLSSAPDSANANPGNDASTVTIAESGATLNLTYNGTDKVDKLFIGANQMPAGVYGAGNIIIPQITNSTGPGTLTVLTGPTFAVWIAGTFANGTIPLDKQGPNDDYDNDGIRNLVEFAIAGQDPTVGNPAVGTFNGTTLGFTKRSGITGLTYAIVESTDLGLTDDWTEVPTGGSYVNNATTISFTLTPPTPPKNFIRLKVTQP